ncbi:MAG: hypothetical protein WCI56_02725 [Hyphomicrobiales bacterium]
MRNLTAIAAAFGLLIALSAPSFAANTDFSAATKKPTADQCKKDPKLKGCPKMSSLTSTDFSAATKKPTADQCKKDPKLKGCPKM